MKFRLLFVAVAATLIATEAQADGWHASILGGTVWSPHLSVGGVPQKIDSGFNAGGRLGYDLRSWTGLSGLSLDADVFYTQSGYSGSQSRLSSLSMMGDLVYRVDLGLPVGVYAGAGAGAVRTMVDSHTVHDAGTVFGWQALGGVDYQFTPETKMFAEYRYQNAHNANVGPLTGVGYTSNNVSVGLKFDL
ncbi:MAG: outer membrane beta-barrel protein [Rhizomicrobium sp.]